MAILDSIKKKLHMAETAGKKVLSSKTREKKKAEPKKEIKSDSRSQSEKGARFGLLKSPHVTEKSSIMQADGKYVFKVADSANKPEIKKSIESTYKVKVTGVNIIKEHGKRVRLGKHEGWSSGSKKAVVTLKKGDKIEIGA